MRGFSGLNSGANARLMRGATEWEKRVGNAWGQERLLSYWALWHEQHSVVSGFT
jgi:hypothetical protein